MKVMDLELLLVGWADDVASTVVTHIAQRLRMGMLIISHSLPHKVLPIVPLPNRYKRGLGLRGQSRETRVPPNDSVSSDNTSTQTIHKSTDRQQKFEGDRLQYVSPWLPRDSIK